MMDLLHVVKTLLQVHLNLGTAGLLIFHPGASVRFFPQ